MQIVNLIKYFKSEVQSVEIARLIADEVKIYKEKTLLKEASISIYAENDNFDFEVTFKHLDMLCNDFICNIFDEWSLSYLFEIIEMSESFEYANQDVEEVVFLLANPIINYQLNKELIIAIRQWLSSDIKEKINISSYVEDRLHLKKNDRRL